MYANHNGRKISAGNVNEMVERLQHTNEAECCATCKLLDRASYTCPHLKDLVRLDIGYSPAIRCSEFAVKVDGAGYCGGYERDQYEYEQLRHELDMDERDAKSGVL